MSVDVICADGCGLCEWVWFVSGCGLYQWVWFVVTVLVGVDGCGSCYLILTCCLQAALNASLS